MESTTVTEPDEPTATEAALPQPDAMPDPEPERDAPPVAVEPPAAPDEPAAEREPDAEIATAAEAEPEAPAAPAAAPAPDAGPEPGPRTAGRFVADALRAAGVRYAFTVPGESFLGILDALGDAGIRVVAARHEGAAAFMAEAYGQLTGRPAAVLATRAVGAANMAIGIHTALQDSTPLFAIVGQVERSLRGREAFQEVDQVESFGRLAKWAAEPSTTDELATAMRDAARNALAGRPGPVLLSLAEDLLDEEMPSDARVESGRPPLGRPAEDEVRAVLRLLTGAERPLILAGAGVLRARSSTDLTRLATMLDIPVVASWRRGDVISNEHPLYLGMAGLGAPATIRERIEASDALLVLGSRLSEPTTFGYRVPAPGTRWAHVDLEPARAGNLPAADVTVTADARSFVRAAIDRLLNHAVLDAGWVDRRREANTADRAAWEAATVVDGGEWSGPGVHPGRTIATLRRVLADDAILTSDAGNFAGWLNRGFRFRRPGTFLGPTSGAMGYGLPAAIAAALVHRDRPVVALVGDGGLTMTLGELETAVREHARVVVLVFDNERYGTIRMWQDRRGTGQGVATDLGPIDFAAVARACGARGARVERDEEFEPALRQALVADRATVIQLALDRAWLSVDERPAG
jgi:acetolactate synthase-1/2/3 large subunit